MLRSSDIQDGRIIVSDDSSSLIRLTIHSGALIVGLRVSVSQASQLATSLNAAVDNWFEKEEARLTSNTDDSAEAER